MTKPCCYCGEPGVHTENGEDWYCQRCWDESAINLAAEALDVLAQEVRDFLAFFDAKPGIGSKAVHVEDVAKLRAALAALKEARGDA